MNTHRFRVDFVERANGNCPSKEFYDSLENPVKAKFIAIAKRIDKSRNGYIRDEDKLKKLEGKHAYDLWEMKVRHKHSWYRILCFRDGSAWKLTNGFEKQGNSTSPDEIKKGVVIKKEYEARRGT